MGIDDIAAKGRELLTEAADKVEQAFGADKVEQVSDAVLDGAASLVKKVAPDELDGKIDAARENADVLVGDEN
jgi:hypothetical protein